MKPLIHEDFLLNSAIARTLYHQHARGLPIIDFHSHLNPVDLAADREFEDLTALWIGPDQYKHRAMRSLGIEERLITGDASPREKFDCWAQALPRTVGNPLFHWTAMELKRFFGVDEALNISSSARIWDICNEQLRQPSHSASSLLSSAGVEQVCTSDQWLDDLSPHMALRSMRISTRVLPSLRADQALAVDASSFRQWVNQLGIAKALRIGDLEAFQHALKLCLDDFQRAGCTVSDHGIDSFQYTAISRDKASALFASVLAGSELRPDETVGLFSYLLLFLGREYAQRGWVMLLHIGAKRDTSSRLQQICGPRGGFAGIGNQTDVSSLCQFLDHLDRDGALPRTVLFNLNPTDNEVFATLTGSFAEEGRAGKIQFGPAWWFNDHDLGICAHLDTLSRYGLLWNFVGMVTDSRSILSMCRFEYFRRILCDWIGGQVEAGTFPDDEALLAEYVRRICYENARDWFAAPDLAAGKAALHG
jgi:glucuronate isomerase